MRGFGRFAGRMRLFADDRRGGMAVTFGVVSVVLMLAAGLALNTGQLLMTKSNLLNALDSAVTSTARDLTTGEIEEEDARKTVEAFLFANGGTGFARADEIVLDSIHVDKQKKTVSAEASVDVALAFPFFGVDRVRHISVESDAIYSDKRIEVAMMLDVTLSMKGQKIKDLKAAAENAVGIMLDKQNPTNPRIRVALVPYAEAVNAGGLADTVYYEEGGRNLPPPEDEPLYVSAGSHEDACATERKNADGSPDYSADGPYTERPHPDYPGRYYLARVNRDDRLQVCPEAPLVPLTADKQKLLDSIEAFKANGVTAGGIAAQWGYYMLSPRWRQAIVDAGMGSGPADYDAKKVAKVAILMTDGQFNTAFAGVPGGESPRMIQGSRARDNAEGICDNMKKDGIAIYTIGFALPSDEANAARAVLKDCASPDLGSVKHFFEAADGGELDAAFKEIIANVERVALTK